MGRVSELDFDRSDLQRLSEFVDQKRHDLLLSGGRHASYNTRDFILEPDLPVTNGLRERMQDFERYEEMTLLIWVFAS